MKARLTDQTVDRSPPVVPIAIVAARQPSSKRHCVCVCVPVLLETESDREALSAQVQCYIRECPQ